MLKKLQEKYDNPLTIISNPTKPKDFLNLYNKNIEKLNEIIIEHKQKVNDHTTEVSKAKEKLELHTIGDAIKEQNYKEIVNNLEKSQREEEKAKKNVIGNNSAIKDLEEKNSNIGEAIGKINQNLEDFFGREEIKLELDRNGHGYKIMRGKNLAKSLSESEKTAIAFSYFIVKVGENDFNKSEAIIFIDDPISSFDSTSIHHCFSMIYNNFKEVRQLFISTHNFQFFNLVKYWFVGNNKNRKKEGKDEHCEFFMVENSKESDTREAKIARLDKTLLDYNSEYHFLFAKLKRFLKEQDNQYEDFYTIGNMARRFFDIFLDFKIPNQDDQRSKIYKLIKNINKPNKKISQIDADKVYKLFNEFSHNSDPISAIEHMDKSESRNAIKVLLNIVEKSDPQHYKYLSKNCIT